MFESAADIMNISRVWVCVQSDNRTVEMTSEWPFYHAYSIIPVSSHTSNTAW